ncbi:ATP-binding protein [uncultured Xylophilus sp.]|uniref:sensor histidine kinase n=1 Tax=uncultured Xylophilus sp. TaxID=296832 RepID=UPI0034516BA4
MRGAISNLFGNASRYADCESTIHVKISREQHDGTAYARITVTNQGAQITPIVQTCMFDGFFRADSARQDARSEHHGLGLAIVAAIVRMHEGEFSAICTDCGSTAFLTLKAN